MGILDGKVVVITGAGHGVGRAHALAMAAEGAKVVVNDLGGSTTGEGADKRPAETVAELLHSKGAEAVANYDDVSDMAGAKNMIDQAIETYGRLDVLVNNAGILRDKMIFNMEEAEWDAIMKVHLKGHFAPARWACAYWRDQSKAGERVQASVINTSSTVGLHGNTGQTNYAAAKGGIAMFTIALANDMERYGVRSNCVAPSANTRLIATIPGRAGDVPEPDEYTEWNASSPANVSPLVVWLASDLSIHVNGQVFNAGGTTVTHYHPWTPNVRVNVPGGDRAWDPQELGRALNTVAFSSRHGAMRESREWQAEGKGPF
jgi:NAD(P)-dependent dehydrogenase (short-subunit alcohol dehydrogenase family)